MWKDETVPCISFNRYFLDARNAPGLFLVLDTTVGHSYWLGGEKLVDAEFLVCSVSGCHGSPADEVTGLIRKQGL